MIRMINWHCQRDDRFLFSPSNKCTYSMFSRLIWCILQINFTANIIQYQNSCIHKSSAASLTCTVLSRQLPWNGILETHRSWGPGNVSGWPSGETGPQRSWGEHPAFDPFIFQVLNESLNRSQRVTKVRDWQEGKKKRHKCSNLIRILLSKAPHSFVFWRVKAA